MATFIVSKVVKSYFEQVIEADNAIEAEAIAEENEYELISQDEYDVFVEMEIDEE